MDDKLTNLIKVSKDQLANIIEVRKQNLEHTDNYLDQINKIIIELHEQAELAITYDLCNYFMKIFPEFSMCYDEESNKLGLTSETGSKLNVGVWVRKALTDSDENLKLKVMAVIRSLDPGSYKTYSLECNICGEKLDETIIPKTVFKDFIADELVDVLTCSDCGCGTDIYIDSSGKLYTR